MIREKVRQHFKSYYVNVLCIVTWITKSNQKENRDIGIENTLERVLHRSATPQTEIEMFGRKKFVCRNINEKEIDKGN